MARCALCRIQCYKDRPFSVHGGRYFHTNCLERWKAGDRPAALTKRYQQKRRRFYMDDTPRRGLNL